MDDLSDMTLDKFKLWSINALKVFLSLRKKSVNGTFEELSARAFCAWEEHIPIDEKAEQNEIRLLQEYKVKLQVDSDVIPDPFSVTEGWKGEKEGMYMWPGVYVTDIAKYLNCNNANEVVNRVLNEYKEGKAYRYFDCGWVKEVFYHTIRENSNKCLMKAKVTPSQSINNKNYNVWIVIRKDIDGKNGGEILSAYCSCTAGMHGTCNHIVGVLFRVEHAVKTGVTEASCTDRLSQWNIPKAKISMKPLKVKDVIWTKSNFMKGKENSEAQKEAKSNFTPLTKAQNSEVSNRQKMREKLYGLLKKEVPDAVFILSKEMRKLKVQKPPTSEIPSLISKAEDIISSGKNQDEKEAMLVQSMKMNSEDINIVKNDTLKQSKSSTWKEHRKGRITASNFSRVNSRVNSLRKDPSQDPSSLIMTIIGQKETGTTAAMKHGLSLEPLAKREYTKLMKRKHKQFESKDSGLSIFEKDQCIAASADLEVSCACCGSGLSEIKCPYSIKGSVPSEENLKYITKCDNKYILDKSHQYYYQVQGQMGVLGKTYCDLFIYTFHGNICIRIEHDPNFWRELSGKLSWFWNQFVLKELVRSNDDVPTMDNSDHDYCSPAQTITDIHSNAPDIRKDSSENSPPSDIIYKTPIKENLSHTASKASNVRRALHPLTSNTKGQTRKLRKISVVQREPVYLCLVCGLDCVDNPVNDAEQSVGCDKCDVWAHYICVGVNDTVIDKEWICSKCQ